MYETLWLPLQDSLASGELETLFWLDLVQRQPRIKQTDTYAKQQARLDQLSSEGEIEAEVARFARLGRLFATILRPDQEEDAGVRRGLERLNAWGTTTVYPLLLHMLDRRDQGGTDDETIARAMSHIEAFLVRRLLVGRVTTNLNRVLLDGVTELGADRPLDEAVRSYLSTGRKYYASDAELRQAVETQAFYWNGKPHQRALVLRWLEESYGSKEPVNLDGLTIEHVLPQTPTPHWHRVIAADLNAEENLDEAYASLVHTLGNLTLTGYNSELSNSNFEVKRGQLGISGLAMNQEIATEERWGRLQILARSRALAERAIALWPGPTETAEPAASGLWQLMNQALAEVPAGSWTTYGDLAVLIGSHPVPVGMRLASHPAPNAHRVLQAAGTVSPGFHWLDSRCADDPMQVLREEGVVFDNAGHADPAQRITAEDLAESIGLSTDSLLYVPDPVSYSGAERRDLFVEQLSSRQDPAVVTGVLLLLDQWAQMGGTPGYGGGKQTSCFVGTWCATAPLGFIWPLTIYPVAGKAEVVFQYLAARPPFDDLRLREELRQRLNAVPGIDLPASKLQLRPSFTLDVLADHGRRAAVIDCLEWFLEVSADQRAGNTDRGRLALANA